MLISNRFSFFKQIPSTVWAIGLVTLLLNLSTIIIFSLSPLYITQVFGLAAQELGHFEAVIESSSWFTRIFAGLLSDALHRRKSLLVFACGLTVLSRPLFALAPHMGWIYTSRLMDRIANGFQATPREALVGDVAPPGLKGACYGLRQTLSVIGSLIGAVGVMYLMHHTKNNYQLIFLLASIPSVFAFLALIFFVKDGPVSKPISQKVKISWSDRLQSLSLLRAPYWNVVGVASIFMISNYSGSFMILQAKLQGFSDANVPMVMVLQNLCAVLSAYPMGRLSDYLDRRILLSIGFALTILSNLLLGFADGTSSILAGAALWGLQVGINQSLLLTKVADTTPSDIRATGFGIYYFFNGVSLFISNTLTGYLFKMDPLWAFLGSAAVAALALLMLPLLKMVKSSGQTS